MAYSRRKILIVIALGVALVLTACAANPDGNTQKIPVDAASANMPTELRFGYFPNFTHAIAIVALEKGYLARHLGKSVKLSPVTFNAGPAAVEAIFGGAVDVTLAGPNPTITGFVQSKGAALEVISGAASGGAGLVVRKGSPLPQISRARRSRAPSWATLRTWPCVTGSKKGLKTTTEEAVTSTSFRRTTRRPSRHSSPAISTARGFLNHGLLDWWQEETEQNWLTSRACGRTENSSSLTLSPRPRSRRNILQQLLLS